MCACYKCPRGNHAANWRSSPARVPGEDGPPVALPANGQHGEQSLEDGSETVFKEKGIDTCKCVRPLFLKDVRIKCVKHMEN